MSVRQADWYYHLWQQAYLRGDHRAALRYRRLALRYSAGWEESKHPRHDDGKFAPKGEGGTGGGKPETPGAAPEGKPSSSPPPDGSKTPSTYASPLESKAVQRRLSGQSQHSLFTKMTAGAGRDTMLEEILQESGRSEPPQVVSEQQMADLQKKGWTVSYRGVGKEKYTDDFKRGTFYAGSGLFGNGIYVQKEGGLFGWGGKGRDAAIKEARGYGQNVMRIAWPPSAKVVSLSQVEKEQKEYTKTLTQMRWENKLTQEQYETAMEVVRDAGRFAALRNYDIIKATSGGYYNIVNRSILAVQDSNV